MDSSFSFDTVKPVGNDHYQKDQKMFFLYQLSLNAGQKFAECSKGSILQYFRPSLSYHLLLRSLFCLFLSGCFTQVWLYNQLGMVNCLYRGDTGYNFHIRLYTRGLWKRITIFLHFSCKPYMRLKRYLQVLMCNTELVWISHFDCTFTRRCWWRHMGTYSIQHLSAQIIEAFWLFLCLNCGVYDAMLPKSL